MKILGYSLCAAIGGLALTGCASIVVPPPPQTPSNPAESVVACVSPTITVTDLDTPTWQFTAAVMRGPGGVSGSVSSLYNMPIANQLTWDASSAWAGDDQAITALVTDQVINRGIGGMDGVNQMLSGVTDPNTVVVYAGQEMVQARVVIQCADGRQAQASAQHSQIAEIGAVTCDASTKLPAGSAGEAAKSKFCS